MDAKNTAKSAALAVGDKKLDLPVKDGSIGPSVVDIAKLYGQTGMFTYDPGFTSTASCESQDHLYRRRRRRPALSRLSDRAARRARRLPRDLLPAAVRRIADAAAEGRFRLPRDPPHHGARADEPLLPGLPARRASDGGHGRLASARCRRSITTPPTSPTRTQRMIASIRMIAKMPTLAAMAYKYSIGQPFVYPQQRARLFVELPADVLRGAVRGLQVEPGARRARWTAFSSCMPTTSRMPRPRPCALPVRRAPIRSPASRPALPASGVRRMAAPTKPRSRCWKRSARSIASRNTSSASKDKNDPFRLMGFGHRVYKNYDPRAKIMQKTCHEVLAEVGIKDDPLLEVAMELETHRAARRILHREEALSEYRLLFGHHAEGDGLPDHDVHGAVRASRAPSAGSRSGRK